MNAATESPKPRLFLSYSRKDSAFVDELIIFVESYDFEVVIDREDLFPGEQWEPRLHQFISEADTTVCVVSSNWVASQQCRDELAIAVRQGRRVIPIVIDQVRPADMPEELARLQFVFFHGEGRSIARGVVDLIGALRTDIGWVREQSRLLDKASEWNAAGRSQALLLRGTALDGALEWIGSKGPTHTRILPLVAEFVEASRNAQDDEVKKRLRGRVWFIAVGGLAVAGLLSAALLNKALQTKALELEAVRLQFQLNQSSDVDQGYGPDTSTTPTDSTPQPAPATPTSKDGWVYELNADDRSTRVTAGQRVVDQIGGRDSERVVADLVAQLQPPRLDELTATGRFNVLYMLNVYDAWPSSPSAELLRWGLDAIEARSRRAKDPIAIGTQTRDCIDKLRAKLAGKSGVGDRCGGL